MKTNSKALFVTTFIYIYLPVILFLVGWTKLIWAIVSTVIIGSMIVFMLRDMFKNYDEAEEMRIHWWNLVLIGAVLAVICIMLGFGGWYPQAGDWYKHNAVLRDLIFNKWPVYYVKYDDCMLTYYLGQYMVPAVIGKIFYSFDAGNITMAVWGIGGLLLVYIHLVRIVKADSVFKQWMTLFVMLFFCGALNLCQNILDAIMNGGFYSLGSYHWILSNQAMLQYRSNLIMIRWVFPQIIVPWIVTILLMENRKLVKHYVMLILPTILFGTFSFGALVVYALVLAIVQLLKQDITIEEIFSLSNILTGLSLGLITFFYFLGYMQVPKPVSSSFRWQIYKGNEIWVYIMFCVFMFGIYAAAVWKECKKDYFFYISLAVLLFLPWCRMGLCNDVVMSGSIPSLFILMIFVLQLLFNSENSTELGIRKGIVIVILAIGCIYPFRELTDNVKTNSSGQELGDGYFTMEEFTDRSATDISEDLVYNYYTYDMDNKFFYKYIARVKALD